MLTLANKKIEWLALLLRPLSKFCLRHSLHFQDLMEAAKIALVESAKAELSKNGEKINISRLSALTGLQRKDLARLVEGRGQKRVAQGLIAKILGAWLYDRRFSEKPGKARDLNFEGENNEFAELVSTVSSDLNVGTVLFELERSGVVRRSGATLCLATDEFIPKADIERGFEMLALDGSDLIQSVESNVFSASGPKNLHARTEFDNVHPEAVAAIRTWMFREGKKMHAMARKFISKFDQDLYPPKVPVAGMRVSFGSFAFIDEGQKK